MARGNAIVSTWEGSLVALDLTDGSVAWQTELGGGSLGPAATDGDVVVATWEAGSGRAAGAVAVDASDGAPRWAVPLEPDGVSGPTVVGSVVVLVAGDIAAHGLDLADGTERWRFDTEGAGSKRHR